MDRETRSIPVEQLIGQLDQLSLTPEQVDKLRSIQILVWCPIGNETPSPQVEQFALALTDKLEQLLGRKIISPENEGGQYGDFFARKKIREAQQIIVVIDWSILNKPGINLKQIRMMIEKSKNYLTPELILIPLVIDQAIIPAGFPLLVQNQITVTDPGWWDQVVDRMLERVETGTDLTSSADAVGQLDDQLRRQFVPAADEPDSGARYTPADQQVAPVKPWQASPPRAGAYRQSSNLQVDTNPFVSVNQPTFAPVESKPGVVVGRFVAVRKPEPAATRSDYSQPPEQAIEPPLQRDDTERTDQGKQELLTPLSVLVWYPVTDSQNKSQAELWGPSIADQIESMGMSVVRTTDVNQGVETPFLTTAARNVDLVFLLLDEHVTTVAGNFHAEIQKLMDVSDEIPNGGLFLIPVSVDGSMVVPDDLEGSVPLDYRSKGLSQLPNIIAKRREQKWHR